MPVLQAPRFRYCGKPCANRMRPGWLCANVCGQSSRHRGRCLCPTCFNDDPYEAGRANSRARILETRARLWHFLETRGASDGAVTDSSQPCSELRCVAFVVGRCDNCWLWHCGAHLGPCATCGRGAFCPVCAIPINHTCMPRSPVPQDPHWAGGVPAEPLRNAIAGSAASVGQDTVSSGGATGSAPPGQPEPWSLPSEELLTPGEGLFSIDVDRLRADEPPAEETSDDSESLTSAGQLPVQAYTIYVPRECLTGNCPPMPSDGVAGVSVPSGPRHDSLWWETPPCAIEAVRSDPGEVFWSRASVHAAADACGQCGYERFVLESCECRRCGAGSHSWGRESWFCPSCHVLNFPATELDGQDEVEAPRLSNTCRGPAPKDVDAASASPVVDDDPDKAAGRVAASPGGKK
jgi:hypothetical protein